jgi:hypothetical protein
MQVVTDSTMSNIIKQWVPTENNIKISKESLRELQKTVR